MSGMWGNKIKISIFGESHGNAIGINIDGLEPGFEINLDKVSSEMKRRAPGRNNLSTPRKEADEPEILSGFFQGKTTGTPLCAIIRNNNTKSKDYGKLKDIMRPGHADYTGKIRYNGFNDYRGGGHFSGRITASIVFAGAICKQILEAKGIKIVSHIKSIGTIEDKSFLDEKITEGFINSYMSKELQLIDEEKEKAMIKEIMIDKEELESISCTVECAFLRLEP